MAFSVNFKRVPKQTKTKLMAFHTLSIKNLYQLSVS